MLEKFENLNINDLDVQELENRLEMTMMEEDMEAAKWVRVEPAPPQNPCPTPGIPQQPKLPVPPGCSVTE